MSLPVSQYEELLAEVRGLRRRAQRVQRLADPFLAEARARHRQASQAEQNALREVPISLNGQLRSRSVAVGPSERYSMDSVVLQHEPPTYDRLETSDRGGDTTGSEDECRGTRMSVSSEPAVHGPRPVSMLYHGTWPVERSMWNSEPANLGPNGLNAACGIGSPRSTQADMTSVMSFASSSGAVPLDQMLDGGSPLNSRRSSQQLEVKMDMVYSLLSVLGGQEHADMGDTLLALSTSPESSLAMRQSGCIPLLVQMVHSDRDAETRRKAAQALHNLVQCQPDEKLLRRETRVLKLLEQIRTYNHYLLHPESEEAQPSTSIETDKHPVQTIAHLMKLSFDEGHRQAICQLGGIHVIAQLMEMEHSAHHSNSDDVQCVAMRRYANMALTNLTFGDGGNKALLCSFKNFMKALVAQLQNSSDELRQVTASVLRNLSWRADSSSKEILKDVGTVKGLMIAAMVDSSKEATLKSILSALWNLSAHCSENKAEICSVEGALGFLVDMLSYKTPSKSLEIIENSGGILRNISSHIAICEDYRTILRKHNCLQVLLEQLKSPSLTIVSNACGTLWNLSAKCPEDQVALWDMGAAPMLRSLNHSKHKMIAMGSSAALKNLLSSRPSHNLFTQLDSTAKAMDLPILPTLGARKQKALVQELDQNLSETCENIEPTLSPTKSAVPPIKATNKADKPENFLKKETEKYIPAGFMPQKTTTASKVVVKTEITDNTQCDGMTQAFNSLSISASSSRSRSSRSRIPQSSSGYGSSSLPFINTRSQSSSGYIPVRNKYSDCEFGDENDCETEQPIDYSQKFVEKQKKTIKTECFSSTVNTDYAETDLDQPTDYSLRYAENDSDSEDLCKVGEVPLEYEDTLKTYCTEGTPYETPFNFSTATSMSDLREGDVDTEKVVIDNDKSSSDNNKTKSDTKNPAMSHLDEKDHCSVEDITELDSENRKTGAASKITKSEFSSGMMSPEKPVNYCDEGTPGYFSRVSSFGSLNSIPLNDSSNVRKISDVVDVAGCSSEPVEKQIDQSKETQAEGKVVTFGRVVDYAEETPLMFSRSSSLGSLDSIEQHSIHDDRSSVVSDFSRLTSGIVSPSELPDSPTQTVPPSPRQRKAPQEFSKVRPQPAPRHLPKLSVFEDNVIKFKEESTPAQFSTATSLSSLTIDDEIRPPPRDLLPRRVASTTPLNLTDPSENDSPGSSGRELEGMEKQDIEQEKNCSESESCVALSEGEEGDDDILAACINIGMQNNRHRENKHTNSPQEKALTGGQHSNNYGKYQMKLPSPCSASNSSAPTKVFSNPSAQTSLVTNIRKTEPFLDSVQKYCTEDTPGGLSYAGSHSDLSVLSFEQDSKNNSNNKDLNGKPDYSDDSSNLSVDHESMLEECIQSGMPKAKPKITSTPTSSNIQMQNRSVLSREDLNKRLSGQALPPYLAAKDEVESYAVENSPCHFSLRSSLSDLTVDGSIAGLKRPTPKVSPEVARYGNMSGNSNSPASSGTYLREIYYEDHQEPLGVEPVTVLSRQPSLSSLSVESFGSVENAEQALLEQCISFGMPKSNKQKPTKVPEITPNKQNVKNEIELLDSQDHLYQISPISKTSKNVLVASAVENTEITTAVDVPDARFAKNEIPSRKHSPTEENLLIAQMKSGFEDKKQLGALLDNSIEDNCTPENFRSITIDIINDQLQLDDSVENIESLERSRNADTRMLDPDAMIESLDRFTAELVSQSSHLQSRHIGGPSTGEEGDTWNEDTYPNDVSFPSISGSAPNVITFRSDSDNVQKDAYHVNENDFGKTRHAINDNEYKSKTYLDVDIGYNEHISNNFSSLSSSTMTESTLIAMEATKIADAFKSEAEMALSATSIGSLELDNIRPPSNMNSLTSSVTGNLDGQKRAIPKAVARKRSLPCGLMARRALINSQQQTSSLESLSNLDHVNPPSAMGDIDLMENSMISVASITSEVAEDKTFTIYDGQMVSSDRQSQQPNPIFDVKQPNNMLHLFTSSTNSLSNIENINPPSMLNDITDMYNSLADIGTDTIGSVTDIFEDCNTHVIEATTADDISEFSDAGSITPIQSDFGSSSAENTPKKTKNINKRLTPKQRRTLAKERYKTYTVAAEMVIKEEAQKVLTNEAENDLETTNSLTTDEYLTVNDCTHSSSTVTLVSCEEKTTAKLTPKEKRQNDRARFQTQVLDEATTEEIKRQAEIANKSPSRSQISIRKNFMQKRLENKERFRTQTLSESSLSPDISCASPPLSDSSDIHHLLAKGANVILNHLNETKSNVDDFLECETLSLVSNDDESEHNSASSTGYRTYRKSCSYSQNIPVIPPTLIDLQSEVCEDQTCESDHGTDDRKEQEEKIFNKPRIVKPGALNTVVKSEEISSSDDEKAKGIRGKRKALYISPYKITPTNNTNKIVPKSMKTMTSNLVRNVTSTLKSGAALKQVGNKLNKTTTLIAKPPVSQLHTKTNTNKPPSGYINKVNVTPKYGNTPKTLSPSRSPLKKPPESPKRSIPVSNIKMPLERQGTFTKEEQEVSTPKSKLPLPSEKKSKIAKAITSNASAVGRTVSKIHSMIHPSQKATPSPRNNIMKSASADRANKTINRLSDRSPSIDREIGYKRNTIHYSSSSQSLKSNDGTSGAIKRSSIPNMTSRSNSNTSITSNGSGKKQVTSKIASLWKRVEESKKQTLKKPDTRVWISPDSTTSVAQPQLVRGNTFETKSKDGSSQNGVVMRKTKDPNPDNTPKRLSRLGSFIQMDERIEYNNHVSSTPEVSF